MENEEPSYEGEDAWLLLAIIYANRNEPATLAKVIAAGDAINHAILTPAELEGGLARLTRGGYVDEVEGAFIPSQKAFDYEGASKIKGAISKELKSIRKMLAARESETSLFDESEKYPGFTIVKYEDAIEEYRREIER